MSDKTQAWMDLEGQVLRLVGLKNYGDPTYAHLADDVEMTEESVMDAARRLIECATGEQDQPAGADMIDMLIEFHSTYGHPMADRVTRISEVDHKVAELRSQLMIAELKEYMEAALEDDVVEMFDGLLDLLYVVLGSLITFYPADKVRAGFAEVHRSNMTKLGEDGKPIYDETGKVVKGPHFELPRLQRILGVGE